jgi:hypothetical protein
MVTSVFGTRVIKIQQIMNTASLLLTAFQQLVGVPLTQSTMAHVSIELPLLFDHKF